MRLRLHGPTAVWPARAPAPASSQVALCSARGAVGLAVGRLTMLLRRVPEELKKHYLSDGEGGQYSTNLDRNRYGNDDNYLFTVIRYDLEFLGLCPCMVDVEIIDAKQGNQSTIVSAGNDVCTCNGVVPKVRCKRACAREGRRRGEGGTSWAPAYAWAARHGPLPPCTCARGLKQGTAQERP